MKILVLIFLCSCVFGVPLGEQEEALAELLQKVLEADPEENDIVLEEYTRKPTSTEEKNSVANATELPLDKVDTTSIAVDKPSKEKHATIIGEIILDPTPEEDTTEIQPVTEIIEQSETKSDLDKDTEPLTGTLIIETIDDDDNDNANIESEVPAETDYLEKSPRDEPKGDPSEFDGLDTPIRIPLDRENLNRNWGNPFPNRFSVFRPLNRDYNEHIAMLENPFVSPLDTLPMDKTFFESTTHADYDVPSQDYPMYDDVYDDEQAPKNMNNESDSMKDSLEPLPEENELIQVPTDLKVPNEQTDVEDSAKLPLEEISDADQPPASKADNVDNGEAEITMPMNSDGIQDDVRGDYDYVDHQIQDYPLQNNPEFERNYYSSNMEREPDYIRYNDRDRFRPHYYDSYDKYINIGDIKHFNPYFIYPKRSNGYDLFFRPPYDVEIRGKMTPLAPPNVMEPPRKAELKYDDSDNMNFDKMTPQDNIDSSMDEANVNIDNTNDYVDNENVDSVDQPQDNSFAEQGGPQYEEQGEPQYVEQGGPQYVYNENYDNRVKWNPPRSVLSSDFTPMAEESLPVQRRNPIIEIPRSFDNGLSYYNENKRDRSMYLFNRLVRNLGDDSRFRRFQEYRNNPYNRNEGPIIVFVGPPRNQDDESNLDTNQVTSESDNQYINSEGTLLTDVKHNVDLPYSPGYHPAFYSNYPLYRNNDNNNVDDDHPFTGTQSFTSDEVELGNHPYNGFVESYPYEHDDYRYHKSLKRGVNRNRDYRYMNDFDNLYKPNRYYYRREPRNFMEDNLYY